MRLVAIWSAIVLLPLISGTERTGTQYDLVTIGDSWAAFIADGAPGSEFDAHTGNAFQTVLDELAPGRKVFNGSFYGGTAASHTKRLDEIERRIKTSGARIVYLSTGGNDFLLGTGENAGLGKGWRLDRVDADAFFDEIAGHVQTIIDHILSLGPDIEVVIGGYDYINLWDPDPQNGGVGTVVRAAFGLGENGAGVIPAHPTATEIEQQRQLNAAIRTLERRKQAIADAHPRVYYVRNFGFINATCGYDGYFGVEAAGELPDRYDDLPVDRRRLAADGNDPIHLDHAGYQILARNAFTLMLKVGRGKQNARTGAD